MKIGATEGGVLEIEAVQENPIPHSCEIHVNAKGEWYGSVKAYAATALDAVNEATSAMDYLKLYLDGKNKGNHRI